jgi:hypothetical protein
LRLDISLRQPSTPVELGDTKPNNPNFRKWFPMSSTEKYYTCREIGELWSMHAETVRPLFAHVPGVIKINRKATRNKRGYTSLRIPQSIVDKVHATLSKAA